MGGIEFNIEFVQEVAKYPCLFDYTREDYSNRSAQDQAWEKISHKLDAQGKS